MNLIKYMNSILENNNIFILMLVILSGMLASKIKIYKISLGISAVIFTGIIAGHFGYKINSLYKNTGLILFLFSVGTSAGPEFISSIKSHGTALIITSFLIVFSGLLTAITLMKFYDINSSIMAGLFTGALTSTPGLAAAVNSVKNPGNAASGYAAAYPFGVIGVIISVNIIMFFKNNTKSNISFKQTNSHFYTNINENHFIYIAFTIICGLVLGNIRIPITENIKFQIGTTGGILLCSILTSLLFSKNTGNSPIPENINYIFRQIGLLLFLSAVGTDAGNGFIKLIEDNGIVIFITGALITIIPISAGFIISKYIFKIELDKAIGLITGGMTSTPGLAAAQDITKNPDTAAAYATVYPFTMIFVLIGATIIANIN